jgi:predicted nucleic acid-binding protein
MENKLTFIDSNFIVGLTVNNDEWHDQANKLIPHLNKRIKITCLSVVFESITLINKKVGVDIAKTVYEYIMNNFIVITEDKTLCDKSIQTLVKYHKLSLTDSTIVEIMKKMNIIELISFDDDFDRVNGILRIH